MASFCFHDHEAQTKPPMKHFSRELQHGRLHALLYTALLYKYDKSVDGYETLDWTVSPKINLNDFQETNNVYVSEATVPRLFYEIGVL